MSRALSSPYRVAAVARIQDCVLDVLAREACVGCLGLSAAIGDWSHADVVLALRGLVQSGAVVRAGERRSAVYRLSGQEVAA